ncbi:Ca2 /calmodulin-dependent protein kinase, EF-Hand protein superfamily [Plasmopara halstedii]|uniref:Ca2 /calmodulin-dependent protein kinase, EF-Hand protein superfamily n=1 Tax=Plasmopara halstedii TaxID=4781 RepID=A0A0P1AHP1_PLAHL|nr:Ca2 /calmodulin-dependent protein kinase, EF-Hand protein superfamily [Plasmopara halstedii]CEG40341.1 Ca2 /calmodulin-dependent protein kinase, EF-Hand protein superfamily [Plasmopara halstedii]|eukprot:XP_024576710.1 Ca2 /calmodulin-dependent protein kinase, EF-Hand protein superfamily [Plasmopara halstedii]
MTRVSTAVTTFKNIPARTRSQRDALCDKEQLEKDRLRARKEGFVRPDTSEEEVRKMLTQLGITQALGAKKIDAILDYVDALPTRSLRYDDFCRFVYGNPKPNEVVETNFTSCTNNRQLKNNDQPDKANIATLDSDCVVSLLRAKYESRRLQHVFRAWDIDKSGSITMSELENNLHRQGLQIAKSQLKKLFDTYDQDHDGQLLYHEFMRLVYGPIYEQRHSCLAEQRRKKHLSRLMHEGDPLDFIRRSVLKQTSHRIDNTKLKAALRCKLKTLAARPNLSDENQDETLHYNELYHGLQDLGFELSKHEFLQIAKGVDADGSGKVSLDAFCDIFKGAEAFNRQIEYDTSAKVEEQRLSADKNHRQDTKAFDYSNPSRRLEVPTRRGRTPYTNTKGLIVYGPIYEQRHSCLAEQRRKKHLSQLMHEEDPLDFIRRSGAEAFNRRQIDNDTSAKMEEQGPSADENHRKDTKAFDCSKPTRRLEVPTRRGRTPYTNTKGLIGNQEIVSNPTQFTTKAQLYGNVILTLGQEDKKRHNVAIANRLQRLRIHMERHESQAKLLEKSNSLA